MPRKVVIVGYPGVQALDVVGPHDVFTAASLLTGGGYDVAVASVDGQPVATATGLAFVATPLPDPGDPIDTVVLPGGAGIDAARSDAELVAWVKRESPQAAERLALARRGIDGAHSAVSSLCGRPYNVRANRR